MVTSEEGVEASDGVRKGLIFPNMTFEEGLDEHDASQYQEPEETQPNALEKWREVLASESTSAEDGVKTSEPEKTSPIIDLEEMPKTPEPDKNKEADKSEPEDEAKKTESNEENGPEKKVKPQPKKRPRLNELTPNRYQEEVERRKEAKRVSSRAWHATFVKKGVRKEGEPTQESEPPEAKEASEPAQPSQPCDDLKLKALEKDLRKVRADFVAEWMKKNNENGKATTAEEKNDLRNKANEAWMDSELRAEIMAARKGQQF